MNEIMNEEVRLHANIQERQFFTRMSELYAIIKTTEHLEAARMSSSINDSDYASACHNLIGQFKDAEGLLRTNTTPGFPRDGGAFMDHYDMRCPLARERLITYGVPATVLHRRNDDQAFDAAAQALLCAETATGFVTAMDALRLDHRAMHELQPYISELTDKITSIPTLPAEFEPISKLKNWLIQLNQMRATDELDADQATQLLHDLEQSYNNFVKALEQMKQRK
uniref:Vacuolar protein sorting-associated protein 28 homolog n=1 Tax=Fibrocapsa japonica TaxID=94617 RepID=A0A7S2Y138_9STRA